MTASIFLSPPRATDANGNTLPGALWYFYDTGTTTPHAVYADGNLTTPLTNPVVADSGGLFPSIYTDPAVVYRAVLKTATGVTLIDIDPYISPGFPEEDLASTAAGKGASLVGNENGGTVQDFLDGLEVVSQGALPAGTTAGFTYEKSFSGHSGGTTDFRGWVDKVTASGSNAIAQVNARNVQVELTGTGGFTSTFGTQSYIRAGLAGVGAVNVTSARVFDAHVANEGTGTVNTATCYFADGVDLLDGTGTIGTMMGFYAGNQGHATRVTAAAVGFTAGDQTAGAPFTAGFRSLVSDGSNKWGFYSEGGAPNQFTGKVGIGSATRPTDSLELFQGYAKLCGSTTKLATGSYHEIRTAANDYTCFFSNSHASAPNGLRMRFSGASPNNTTQRFLYCDDPTADRLVIWSNGNVVNANNSYGAISDKRLKRDITDARSQIDDIRALRFRNYRLKSGGTDSPEHLGLIAQEAMKVSPGLVSSFDMDGKERYQINYSLLYLKTAKALQEALALIDDLTARVSALEAG